MPFLDLKGQLGRAYRFRHVADPADLPARAGTFVLARGTSPGAEVVAFGARRSLAELEGHWPDLTADGAQLFVRLTVSRSVRQAEHRDLIAVHPMARLVEGD